VDAVRKLLATAVLSLLQAYAFVIVAALLGTSLPVFGPQFLHVLLAAVGAGADARRAGPAAVGAHQAAGELCRDDELRHLPDVLHVAALYPLWKLEESGPSGSGGSPFNPFTHAVEWIRFALYGKDPGIAPWVVPAALLLCFMLAAWGYDPQRGFGALTKRGEARHDGIHLALGAAAGP
jgi:ABC-2 type transport system permease protein